MLLRNCLARLAMLAAIIVAGAGSATAAPEYRVTVVGPLDSVATAINQAGVVVGHYGLDPENYRAFLSRRNGWVDLGTVAGDSSYAVAINDKGQVLGNWHTADGQYRGVIWYRGTARDIGVVPGSLRTFYSSINNAGYATAQANWGEATGSFLRAPNGTFRPLGSLAPANPITDALAVNNRNQVTGGSGEFILSEIPFRAFLWQRGTMRDLGDFGSQPNVGTDINDRGQVTGFASLPNAFPDRLAFIYSRGRLRDIDGRTSGTRFSQAQGINNLGHAVGDSDHLAGWVYRGRRMQSLNALIDPAPGWNIQRPRAINDAGQIAATGYRNGQQYAVRLDLIRPHLEAAPDLADADDAPLLDTPLSAEEAAVEARLDAEAQAREVVRPVQQ
jgi:uncharacterized membrane protein